MVAVSEQVAELGVVGRCVYPRCIGTDGKPLLTTLGVCEPCRGRYRQLLSWLADDYAQLHIMLPAPVRRGISVRSSSKESFGHPAEWASDEARHVATLLYQIEDALRLYRGVRQRDGWGIREVRLVHRALTYLVNCFDDLCTFPGAELAAEELTKWHYKLRAALGHTRRAEYLALPCPKCNLLKVAAAPHTGRPFCEACGHRIRAEFVPSLTSFAVRIVQTIDDELVAAYDAANAVSDTPEGDCVPTSGDSVTLITAPQLHPQPEPSDGSGFSYAQTPAPEANDVHH